MLLAAQASQAKEKAGSAFGVHEVFIGGAPRSGTTLLLSLLDCHSELLVFPKETYFFDQSIKRAGTGDSRRLAEYLLTKTEIAELDPARSAPIGLSQPLSSSRLDGFPFAHFKDNFLRRAQQRPDGGPRHVLHSLFRAYAEAWPKAGERPRIFVEKTPGNDCYSEKLFKYFPEAKLIQIVRDPRAVYASRQEVLRQSRGRHTKSFRLVNEWNRSVRQRQRLRNRPEQFLSIRYEDLLAEPRATLAQICAFLGIDNSALTLSPSKAGQPWPGNSSYESAMAGISEIPLDRWKHKLNADEVAWVDYHCQEGMRECGYPILSDLSSPARNFRQWLRPLPWESWLGYVKARRASLCWKLFPNYMMRTR